MDELRERIQRFLGVEIDASAVPVAIDDSFPASGYVRQQVSYPDGEGGRVPAFLLLPEGEATCAGVVVHHQHAGARHLGKSEVCGLAGDPMQAFGPRLAARGIVVLAPDSICFEERRRHGTGTTPHEADTLDHYHEMAARLVTDDTLMRRVIEDSARAVSVLRGHSRVDPARVGMLGHSYGGSTTLFHGALDERVRFAAASGTGASYRGRLERGLALEMSQVIPGIVTRFDMAEILACFAPRPLLLVSGETDPHALDADQGVAAARELCRAAGSHSRIEHRHDSGGHALTEERVTAIEGWLAAVCG